MGWALVALVVGGFCAGRVTMINARGGIFERSAVFALLGTAANFMTLSLLIWGFLALAWYWPIAAFVVAAVLSGISISGKNTHVWASVHPALNIVVVFGGFYLWVWRWPF